MEAGEGRPLSLASSVSEPAADEEIANAWPDGLPPEVAALWRTSRSSQLCVDTEYGQWGLVLAPSELRARRILIALPLDGRSEWYAAGSELGEFLERYHAAGGDKFWERDAPERLT